MRSRRPGGECERDVGLDLRMAARRLAADLRGFPSGNVDARWVEAARAVDLPSAIGARNTVLSATTAPPTNTRRRARGRNAMKPLLLCWMIPPRGNLHDSLTHVSTNSYSAQQRRSRGRIAAKRPGRRLKCPQSALCPQATPPERTGGAYLFARSTHRSLTAAGQAVRAMSTVVGLPGLEPGTFGPPDRRANQAAPQPVGAHACASRAGRRCYSGVRTAPRATRRPAARGSRGTRQPRRAAA